MSNKLDHLLAKLIEQADATEQTRQSLEFRYKSFERLIVETGKPFVKRVESPFNGTVKLCYKNCFKALNKYPNLFYCEGYAIDDDLSLAIPHAWLVNEDSQVIDPTWTSTGCEGSTYFGVVFSTEFVVQMAAQTKHYGILENDYLNDFQLLRSGFRQGALHPKFHP